MYLEGTFYPPTIMPLILDLHSLPTPLIALFLASLLPTASATGTGGSVHTSGFWLGFSLLVVISAAESAFSYIWTRTRVSTYGIHPESDGVDLGSDGSHPGSDGVHPAERSAFSIIWTSLRVISNGIQLGEQTDFSIIWTRIRFISNGIYPGEHSASSTIRERIRITYNSIHPGENGIHPGERSCRVCGREIAVSPIHPKKASEIATRGAGGCGFPYLRTTTVTETCGLKKETVIDQRYNLALVLNLLIRRFNPKMSLQAPARLVNTVKDLVGPRTDTIVVRAPEHAVDLLISLTDVSLAIAVLALNPSSPRELWDTIKDPKASMTFQNYTTLFLLYWLLGLMLLLCMMLRHSTRASIQISGWPGIIASAVSSSMIIALFCLGCWKIDFARRHHTPWTPMLSYWISGASKATFPERGVDLLNVFGTVCLAFMLKHTFH